MWSPCRVWVSIHKWCDCGWLSAMSQSAKICIHHEGSLWHFIGRIRRLLRLTENHNFSTVALSAVLRHSYLIPNIDTLSARWRIKYSIRNLYYGTNFLKQICWLCWTLHNKVIVIIFIRIEDCNWRDVVLTLIKVLCLAGAWILLDTSKLKILVIYT